ncbi:hypothetical protein D3C71_2148970 [compost metagenome]
MLADACARLKLAGFRYVVLVSAAPKEAVELGAEQTEADLIVQMSREELDAQGADAKRTVAEQLTKLWMRRESV